MARISAWLAVAAAAAIAIGMAPYVRTLDFSAVGPLLAAALLALGAWRTLTSGSGQVRVLCGAWGLAAGLAWYAPSYNVPDFMPAMIAIPAPVTISGIGLLLALFHRERRV